MFYFKARSRKNPTSFQSKGMMQIPKEMEIFFFLKMKEKNFTKRFLFFFIFNFLKQNRKIYIKKNEIMKVKNTKIQKTKDTKI